jgi:IS1 family transposase
MVSDIVTKISEIYLMSLHGHPVIHTVSGQTELNQRKNSNNSHFLANTNREQAVTQ